MHAGRIWVAFRVALTDPVWSDLCLSLMIHRHDGFRRDIIRKLNQQAFQRSSPLTSVSSSGHLGIHRHIGSFVKRADLTMTHPSIPRPAKLEHSTQSRRTVVARGNQAMLHLRTRKEDDTAGIDPWVPKCIVGKT
ncbi:hypothetical protein B0H34DRAFT_472547 [Crassisporium funariophilum]|nr:hypothetical protein B0H34DRAFT_472547 [Crassisporium funariophilum]